MPFFLFKYEVSVFLWQRNVFLGAHISGLAADKILNSMYNPGTLALNPQVMNFAVGYFSIVVFAPHSQSMPFTSKDPAQDYSRDAPARAGSAVSVTQALKPTNSWSQAHKKGAAPKLSKRFHSFHMKMLIWPRPYRDACLSQITHNLHTTTTKLNTALNHRWSKCVGCRSGTGVLLTVYLAPE